MNSNTQDSFLIGHARRMRACRKRQRNANPLEYANHVRNQKRQYRSRQHFNRIEKQTSEQELTRNLVECEKSRYRQYRHRLNELPQDKQRRQKKDKHQQRCYRLNESFKEKRKRQDKNCARQRWRRLNESAEDKHLRQEKDKQRKHIQRKKLDTARVVFC